MPVSGGEENNKFSFVFVTVEVFVSTCVNVEMCFSFYDLYMCIPERCGLKYKGVQIRLTVKSWAFHHPLCQKSPLIEHLCCTHIKDITT